MLPESYVLNYPLMSVNSRQLLSVLKIALVALLVFSALLLFGLRYLHQLDEQDPSPLPVEASRTQTSTTKPDRPLFVKLGSQNIEPANESVLTSASSSGTQTLSTPAETNTQPQAATIKQRGQTAQFNSRFTKIAFNGDELLPDATLWSCARDLKTGLLWETKLNNAGISDTEHTYSWFTPDRAKPGLENGGRCFGIACDTQAYITEMNRLELCASTAWRLPTFSELDGLIDRNYYNPTINQEFFPHATGTVYWTSTELENNPDMVMQIDFFNGMSTAVRKDLNYSLRLVSP